MHRIIIDRFYEYPTGIPMLLQEVSCQTADDEFLLRSKDKHFIYSKGVKKAHIIFVLLTNKNFKCLLNINSISEQNTMKGTARLLLKLWHVFFSSLLLCYS